jgi:hypothetical protein
MEQREHDENAEQVPEEDDLKRVDTLLAEMLCAGPKTRKQRHRKHHPKQTTNGVIGPSRCYCFVHAKPIGQPQKPSAFERRHRAFPLGGTCRDMLSHFPATIAVVTEAGKAKRRIMDMPVMRDQRIG